ncbi:MAG TPA: nicotinate phosphoribosyltransferase [Candidatus Paceibacterota bacterium]
MKNKLPKSYFFTYEDLSLIQMSHTFMEGSVWQAEGMDKQIATFDLFVREMPAHRNFMVSGGLEEIVYWLKNIKFSPDEIKFLLKNKLITPKFANYLKNFKFTGDIYAMPEGTIFFPMEPVIRVRAPIIEATLFEVAMFNVLSSNTPFFMKAARMRLASENKFYMSTGPNRGHSFESGFKGARAAYCYDIDCNATTSVNRKYGIKLPSDFKYIINAQHLFIKSFSDELTAFHALAKYNPSNTSVMIDTYDFKSGLKNAITLGKELKQKGHILRYVTIDSGDLASQSKIARKELNKAGLSDTKILICSNLDEYKIADLAKNNVPCDKVVSVTEFMTLSDSPKLEVVYKLAELQEGKNIKYTAKLAIGKISYPGRKQVFRKFDTNGIITGDTIALENEKTGGKPLLQEVMRNGKVVKNLPDIESLKKYTLNQLKTLPDYLKVLEESKKTYPVRISDKIESLLADLKRVHGHDED